jgi:hypothetical protein
MFFRASTSVIGPAPPFQSESFAHPEDSTETTRIDRQDVAPAGGRGRRLPIAVAFDSTRFYDPLPS